MSNESDMEFSLLKAVIDKQDLDSDSRWYLNIFDDGLIIGKIYFKPINPNKFLNIEVMDSAEDTFKARFRPFSVIQEETETSDFDESQLSDIEKRLIVFLLFNNEYAKLLNEDLRLKLQNKL